MPFHGFLLEYQGLEPHMALPEKVDISGLFGTIFVPYAYLWRSSAGSIVKTHCRKTSGADLTLSLLIIAPCLAASIRGEPPYLESKLCACF